MRRLDKRYRAVLRTYFERPAFRILALATALTAATWAVFLPVAYFGLFKGIAARGDLFILLAFLLYLSPLVLLTTSIIVLVWHVRVQLSQSANELIPDYRGCHLRVAVAAFVSLFVIVILIINLIPAIGIGIELWRYGTPLRVYSYNFTAIIWLLFCFELAWSAVALTVMSVIATASSVRSPWYALLILPLGMILFTSSGPQHVLESLFETERLEGAVCAAMLIAADLGMLVFTFQRLRRIAGFDSIASSVKPRTARPEPVLIARPSAPHRLLLTPIARAWHRRNGVLSPFAPWLVGAVLCVVLTAAVLIGGSTSTDLLRSALLPTIVPGVIISLIWRERWMNLGYESLYPADRGQFVQELLAATAFSLMELWVATALAVLPPILVRDPHLLITPMFQITMIASAAMQFLVFGIMFLSALYRPMLPYVNVITILAQLVPISFAWAEVPELSQRGLLAVAGVEMAIGVAITMLGYATWRRADLA